PDLDRQSVTRREELTSPATSMQRSKSQAFAPLFYFCLLHAFSRIACARNACMQSRQECVTVSTFTELASGRDRPYRFAMEHALSPSRLDQFRHDGYLICRKMATPETCNTLLAITRTHLRQTIP